MQTVNKKKNCWEIKRCGREIGGRNAYELGVCPAATEIRLSGIHNGEYGGRACWIVAGTMCEGRIHGTFAQKYNNCGQCGFYDLVKEEEGGGFQATITLLKKIE